jgi:hypothetical protein
MSRAFRVLPVAVALAALLAADASARGSISTELAACAPAGVHYTPYPGGAPGLSGFPWVRATSAKLGLVGLLWYWRPEWRDQGVDRARIYPHGTDGHITMKILWAFLSPTAKQAYAGGRLIVTGRRLDGPGKSWQQFVPIAYAGQNGAPSYASVISLPAEGCWRLQLAAGGLHASVVFEATSAA